MRAVQYAAYGGPEVLQVSDDVPEPHAGPGQVRIAVRAAGVNPVDHKQRSGVMGGDPAALPKIPGVEAAGVVDEVGEGVDGVAVGDEVFGSGAATSAEFALLSAWAAKPASLSFEEAAGYSVAAETSARVFGLLGLKEGDTLLVSGATGGVGTAAVQLAVARGATVIGTASAANQDALRALGAQPTTYGDGLVERVRELAGEGVDLAFDVAGAGTLPQLIELTGSPDRVVTIADFQHAPELGVRATGGSEGRSWEALDEAAALHAEGRFDLPVAQAFSFAQAADAHRVSEDGHTRGKLVLVPGS